MTQTEITEHIPSGRFELSPDQFDLRTKAPSTDVVHKFDLKSVMPDIVGGSSVLPKIVARGGRKILDDLMQINKGLYCNRNGGVVFDIVFEGLPGSAGKTKIEETGPRILNLVNKLKANPDKIDEILATDTTPRAAKIGGNEQFSKILKEGLPVNPTIEEMVFWLSWATQGLHATKEKIPVTQELRVVVDQSEISFAPLWNVASEAVIGGICGVRPAVAANACHSGESLRLDLAALLGTGLELGRLSSRGEQALIILPLYVGTLQHKETREFIVAFLRKIPADMRKALIFEIKGLKRDTPSASIRETMTVLMGLGRAVIVEYGLLTLAQPSNLKLHACGYDVTTFDAGGEHPDRLIKQFEDHYRKQGIKAYIKGVLKPDTLKAAKNCGYAYAAGPAVGAPQSTCSSVRKMPIATLPIK